ncbi:MAG: sugar transferase [Victivallales bacterium]|nr:sugar transferase [Victivallales bacterium]
MGTHTKNNLAKELRRLEMNLTSRAVRPKKVSGKMRVWRFTVAFSYLVKRVADFTIALILLLLLSPFLVLVGLIVKLTSEGPIIFSQTRVGRFGKHFRMYKFRSMYKDAEKHKDELMQQGKSEDKLRFKDKNDPRITPFGRLIRKTSIDELPQLVNILLGDMSLVGPRPPTPDEVRNYKLDYRKRFNVIPGITGLWQVSGRSDVQTPEQMELDKKYIASRSVWFDACIILKTIPAIITGRGAY